MMVSRDYVDCSEDLPVSSMSEIRDIDSIADFYWLEPGRMKIHVLIEGQKLELVQIPEKWQKTLTALISDLVKRFQHSMCHT
jgi:hypothetical protein